LEQLYIDNRIPEMAPMFELIAERLNHLAQGRLGAFCGGASRAAAWGRAPGQRSAPRLLAALPWHVCQPLLPTHGRPVCCPCSTSSVSSPSALDAEHQHVSSG
jgi:hypothetical protein